MTDDSDAVTYTSFIMITDKTICRHCATHSILPHLMLTRIPWDPHNCHSHSIDRETEAQKSELAQSMSGGDKFYTQVYLIPQWFLI